jgi:hypothetical protein
VERLAGRHQFVEPVGPLDFVPAARLQRREVAEHLRLDDVAADDG